MMAKEKKRPAPGINAEHAADKSLLESTVHIRARAQVYAVHNPKRAKELEALAARIELLAKGEHDDT